MDWRDHLDDARAEGYAAGYERGEAAGYERSKKEFENNDEKKNRLISLMLEEGRSSELAAAINTPQALEKLMQEYGI